MLPFGGVVVKVKEDGSLSEDRSGGNDSVTYSQGPLKEQQAVIEGSSIKSSVDILSLKGFFCKCGEVVGR